MPEPRYHSVRLACVGAHSPSDGIRPVTIDLTVEVMADAALSRSVITDASRRFFTERGCTHGLRIIAPVEGGACTVCGARADTRHAGECVFGQRWGFENW